MSDKPAVSVVMPAYNAEKYLREAIDSILSQTFTDFELIIINDGSTDATKDIILGYTDPRVVYLENESNSGICITLNKGLDAAKGRYIARMDSDDISLPKRLEIQVEYMDNNPHIGASGTDIEIFGDGITPHVFVQLHTPEECSTALLFNSCFAHPSVIIRKHIIDDYQLRYKDEFRGLEDYELWWQINKYSQLSNIAIPLLKYRHHQKQETQNVTGNVIEAFKKFTKEKFKDMVIDASREELNLWDAYSMGNFSYFDDEIIKDFINFAKRIIKEYSKRKSKELYALRITLSKGITFALHNSQRIKESHQKYYSNSLLAGVFPLMWYLKVSYHNLIR